MKKMIQALMIAPGEHPFIEELSTAPSALIKAINKGIKHSYKPAFTNIDDGICVMYNKQRSFANLEPNRLINKDILCGVLYVVGKDSDGNLRSLEYDELVKYSNMFWEPEKHTAYEAQIANINYSYKKQVLGEA